MQNKRIAEYLYFLVAATELYAEFSGSASLRFFTKPLLMPALLFFFAWAVPRPFSTSSRLMAAALFFSWIGDVALMFVPNSADDFSLMGIPKDPNFFLVGLVGFLITHILYTFVFTKGKSAGANHLFPSRIWVFLPLFLYMLVLLSVLIPAISGQAAFRPFLVPVLVYATAIAVMVAFAMARYKQVADSSFALVFAGALLFMFSDSIIAVNKFLYPFPAAGIFIMLLYITGQYLIVKGILKQQ